MEIRFYQLSKSTTALGVARLAEIVVTRGQSLGIICKDEKHCENISNALWNEVEFLPHSIGKNDGVSKICVALHDVEAEVIFVVDDAIVPENSSASRLCLLFHAADTEIVQSRRVDWKRFAQNGMPISYWAENDNGSWEKKAEENAKS